MNTGRDVIEHLLNTPAAIRLREAEWLLKHLPPHGDAWATAKAEYARMTEPKTEFERAAA